MIFIFQYYNVYATSEQYMVVMNVCVKHEVNQS